MLPIVGAATLGFRSSYAGVGLVALLVGLGTSILTVFLVESLVVLAAAADGLGGGGVIFFFGSGFPFLAIDLDVTANVTPDARAFTESVRRVRGGRARAKA